jgi:outer membrane lipoprotein-sorting protein
MSLKIVCSFSILGFILAAREPDATDILRQIARTYSGIKSQSFEATVVLDLKTSSMRLEIPMTAAMTRPGKVRFEMNNPMLSSQTISDGRNTWKYVARFQQYTRTPAAPGTLPMMDGPGVLLAGERILDQLQSARLLRQEKLIVDAREVDCDVIEAAYSPDTADVSVGIVKTFWVDRSRRLLLKVSLQKKISAPGGSFEMQESISVSSVRLNEPLAESLFAFVPPEGAREVADLTPPASRAPAPVKDR